MLNFNTAIWTNNWHFFVEVPATFTFNVAILKIAVSCQQFFTTLVAMQNIKLLPGAFTPFELIVTMGAVYFIIYSHVLTF